MVPRPRRRRTQQSANIMRDKSISLKLEDSIVFTKVLAKWYLGHFAKWPVVHNVSRGKVITAYECDGK